MSINVRARVTKSNIRCRACSQTILEKHWYQVVEYEGKRYNLHDSGACLEMLKKKLGLPYNNFLISRRVGHM